MASNSHTTDQSPIPIITVGGFLGAGKTTLVNHLLSQSDGKRIVVFVNDFGAINIDYDLIETTDTDRVSLTNGCVCCSLNDDLIASISEYCTADPPDAFMLEASGVADPRALEQSIASLQRAGRILLVCRVYVLDVDQFGGLDYADTEQIVDHAVASDLVLLNKCRLTDDQKVMNVEELLNRSAPQTIMRRTEYCDVSLNELLTATPDYLMTMNAKTSTSSTHSASEFTSWSCEDFAPLSRDDFNSLLQELRCNAIRAKGTLYFDVDPDTAIKFDFVGTRHVLTPCIQRENNRVPTFVAIGRPEKLATAKLSKYFRNSNVV